jgi:hypothetical protein
VPVVYSAVHLQLEKWNARRAGRKAVPIARPQLEG